jgi:hypothetical protein
MSKSVKLLSLSDDGKIRDLLTGKVIGFRSITSEKPTNIKETTSMAVKTQTLDELAKLYAAAGVQPGEKIPLNTIDAGLAKMDLSITKRMELKSTLHRLGIIAR